MYENVHPLRLEKLLAGYRKRAENETTFFKGPSVTTLRRIKAIEAQIEQRRAVPGVYLTDTGQYGAQVNRHHVGTYNTIEEAVAAQNANRTLLLPPSIYLIHSSVTNNDTYRVMSNKQYVGTYKTIEEAVAAQNEFRSEPSPPPLVDNLSRLEGLRRGWVPVAPPPIPPTPPPVPRVSLVPNQARLNALRNGSLMVGGPRSQFSALPVFPQGVQFNGKYTAHVNKEYIGSYDTVEEAVAARKWYQNNYI